MYIVKNLVNDVSLLDPLTCHHETVGMYSRTCEKKLKFIVFKCVFASAYVCQLLERDFTQKNRLLPQK